MNYVRVKLLVAIWAEVAPMWRDSTPCIRSTCCLTHSRTKIKQWISCLWLIASQRLAGDGLSAWLWRHFFVSVGCKRRSYCKIQYNTRLRSIHAWLNLVLFKVIIHTRLYQPLNSQTRTAFLLLPHTFNERHSRTLLNVWRDLIQSILSLLARLWFWRIIAASIQQCRVNLVYCVAIFALPLRPSCDDFAFSAGKDHKVYCLQIKFTSHNFCTESRSQQTSSLASLQTVQYLSVMLRIQRSTQLSSRRKRLY